MIKINLLPPELRKRSASINPMMLLVAAEVSLCLVALRHMSAFGTQMVTNLEPVYAIVLAILLLGEQHQLDRWFYVGVVVILAAVFVHPLLNRQQRGTKQPELLGTSESHSMVD